MPTILECFSDTETLIRAAQYTGGIAKVSIAMGEPDNAGARAALASHYADLVLRRKLSGAEEKGARDE